jgi:uncharacterized protein (TIGR02217 family)
MPSAFRDEPFPSSIANGATGGPEWLTEIVTTGSGDIKANARWANPLRKYNVATGIKDQAGLADLIDFVLAISMGRAYVFPFQDYSDYIATNQRIGTGDGTTTAFQLTKTYTSKSGAFSYTRTIKLAQTATVQIFVAGVLQNTSAYALSQRGAGGGLVTFNAAPAIGAAVTWSGQFETPCRFDADYSAFALNGILGSLDNIAIREDRLSS